MKKINNTQIQELQEQLIFYDINNLCTKSNKELIVKFSKEVDEVTYSDLALSGNIDNYNLKRYLVTNIINSIAKVFSDEMCIIIKYNKNWVVNKKKSKKLYRFLNKNNIKDRFTKAIVIDKNAEIVDMLIESVLKYNSFIQFVFKKSQVSIIPTDHMDIFVKYENDSIIEKIKHEVIQYNNSEYRDRLNVTKIFDVEIHDRMLSTR